MKPILKSLASKDALESKVRKVLASCGLGIFLLLALVPNDMKAQGGGPSCPTGWADRGCITFPWFGCEATVCYCSNLYYDPSPWPRDTTGGGHWVYQTIVKRVTLSSPCDTNGLTDDLFRGVDSILTTTADNNVPIEYIPPCDSVGYGPMVIQTRVPACWKKTAGGALIPCNMTVYCLKECTLCYTYGHIQSTNCVLTLVGTPDCTTFVPVAVSHWGVDTCYNLNCGPHP
jgi:hypothetical protein